MLGILNSNQVERLFLTQYTGRLGFHANGRTYIVPISYAYDGQYLYAHTHEGIKIDLLRQNPDVCFEVDDIRNTADWQSAIAWGEMEELTDTISRTKALHLLSNRLLPHTASTPVRLSAEWPFLPDQTDEIEGLVFRVGLAEKSGRFEMPETQPFHIY